MPTFPFSIISPRGKTFAGEVDYVSAAGVSGGFGILARHAPLISAVQAGITTVQANGRIEVFYTGQGILEVSHHEVVLLVDDAEKVENTEQARQRVRQRQERRAGASP